LEGSFLGIIEIISWYLPGETEGNHINIRIAGVPAVIKLNTWNTRPAC
jgi:hypothetical protein